MRRTTRTMTSLLAIAALGMLPAAANAEAGAGYTFHRDIEPLFQESCQGCHRPEGVVFGGMIAPMSLVSYDEVRPWAKSIAKKVENRQMPPWFASEEFNGVFTNERSLSSEQVQMVVDWVKSGAPKGDPAHGPEPTQWASQATWLIGEPDLVISLDEPFFVDDDVVDLNISLKAEMITKDMLPEPRWIEAIEFRPDSSSVHHIVASRRAAEAEAPGSTGLLGGMAPGTEPFYLPEGAGRLLVPDTQIFMSMHYNKEPGAGTGVWDRSQIAFKFKPKHERVTKIANWEAIGNGDFEIPPNTANWEVGASKIFANDTTIYGYIPHAHLRGKYAKFVAFYPDGSEENLLEVPWYDWNWQTNSLYREPKTIPAGTRIELTMRFDNTDERNSLTFLDINPNRAVRFGGPTTDEMMLGFIDFAEHTDTPAGVVETPSSGQ